MTPHSSLTEDGIPHTEQWPSLYTLPLQHSTQTWGHARSPSSSVLHWRSFSFLEQGLRTGPQGCDEWSLCWSSRKCFLSDLLGPHSKWSDRLSVCLWLSPALLQGGRSETLLVSLYSVFAPKPHYCSKRLASSYTQNSRHTSLSLGGKRISGRGRHQVACSFPNCVYLTSD